MAGDMIWVPSILDFRQTEIKEMKSKKVGVEDKGLDGYSQLVLQIGARGEQGGREEEGVI